MGRRPSWQEIGHLYALRGMEEERSGGVLA